MSEEKIILYSNNCPNCRKLKMLLDMRNIAYTENNSVDEMLSLGITKVPALGVDGRIMEYKEAQSWVNKNVEEIK